MREVEGLVIKRLESIGYIIDQTSDTFLLGFAIDKNENYILNHTNQIEVPKELTEIWVDMSVADFLETKWATNTLDIKTIDLSPIVNRIQEGDTTIDIATGKDGGITAEDRFLTILSEMRSSQISFARFRRFEW